ncbi:MAG: hypothetical protein ABFR75_00800 [Acidobacteriota bacterium]
MAGESVYFIPCWHCGASFNVFETSFCGHFDPTPLCLYCFRCSCDSSKEHKANIIKNAPQDYIDWRKLSLGGKELKLGEILLNAGKINKRELEIAIAKQKITNEKLGEVFLKMGFISPEDLELCLMDQKAIEEIKIGDVLPNPELVERIGTELCLKRKMIPIEYFEIDEKKILKFALLSREDLMRIKINNELSEYILLPYYASEEEMKILLRKVRAIKEAEDILELK